MQIYVIYLIVIYLGTRKFQKLTDLDIDFHKFNLVKKNMLKRIDPYTSEVAFNKEVSE